MLVLLLSLLIAAADQAVKYAIRERLFPGEIVSVMSGFLNLTYVRNTGAAWGVFSGFNRWLVVLSVVVLLLIVVFRRCFLTDSRAHRVCLGLMIGGIVGNLVDRLRLDYVVDYIDFFCRGYHFPSFNIADAAICTGVGLYMLSTALTREPPDQTDEVGPRPKANERESKD